MITEIRSDIRQASSTRARAVISGLLVSLVLATSASADNQDVIDYRRHIMTTMGEQVAIIGMILEERAPADDFAIHMRVLAVTAATAKKAFEPQVQGGDAKPEVWQNWEDFSRRLDELSAATAELAELAGTGGTEATAPRIKESLTCKGCHDRYRVPDED